MADKRHPNMNKTTINANLKRTPMNSCSLTFICLQSLVIITLGFLRCGISRHVELAEKINAKGGTPWMNVREFQLREEI